jgi:hypothetical protein
MRVVGVVALVVAWSQLAVASDLPSPPKRNPPKPDKTCGAFYDPYCQPSGEDRYRLRKPDVWGYIGVPLYAAGSRQAPNGIVFDPLFAVNQSFNFGILPEKKLYVFVDTNFWMQRPGAGITNPSQGNFDFSKREFDVNSGIAWNYSGTWEARVSVYALNNLNRGTSLASPSGFKDGVLLENRYYFGNADKYDVGRLSFLSLGFYPTKSLVGGNGETFHPGLFARAYATYDLPFLSSYLYGDAKFTAEQTLKPRLLEFDAGWAFRPFKEFRNAEFRLGSDLTTDLQDGVTRDLIYGSARLYY